MSLQAFPFTMLHRHLTAAYRALDSKWGNPVDLDTSDEGIPCLPAIIEKSTTTFSSEEYLRKLRRHKPYSRNEDPQLYRRKKMKDSFSNISRNLGGSVASLDTTTVNHLTSTDEIVLELKNLIQQLKEPLEETLEDDETITQETISEKKEKIESIFKKMKNTTFSYLDLKLKRKGLR